MDWNLMRLAFKPAVILTSAVLLLAAPALATPKLPPASSVNGMVTQNASASDAFPGYKGFLNLSPAERSQIDVYYLLRIKRCDATKVSATLNANGRAIPMRIAPDGRIEPLPTRAQMNSGASVTTVRPESCSVAMKLKVTTTQGMKTSYDAQGLAQGVDQGNSAMRKIAGILAITLDKLDRIYFIGGGDAVAVMSNGQKQPLPRTSGKGEYPAGTPYYVPGQMRGAARIELSRTPSNVLYDTN
jgi:hypothetical protein